MEGVSPVQTFLRKLIAFLFEFHLTRAREPLRIQPVNWVKKTEIYLLSQLIPGLIPKFSDI